MQFDTPQTNGASAAPQAIQVQNQLHDLTKNLPPPRKQNTACDACRSRKVKCNRLPGQDKCQHCLAKSYPCTHYVQQATSEKKRNASVTRRPRNLSAAGHPRYSMTVLDASGQPSVVLGHFAAPPSPSSSSPFAPKLFTSFSDKGLAIHPDIVSPHQKFAHKFDLLRPTITEDTPTTEVLQYIFAPPDSPIDSVPSFPGHAKSLYDQWGELASRLEDDNFKAEFALDLVEVFFQIVHTRLPLLNPDQFRQRLQLGPSSPTKDKPLHPALVATVLAWGTKFSEHPLLVADRRRPSNQSMLAKTLIDRARELGEALKVHRIPTSEHVIIGLLIEPLQSQIVDKTGFQGFWLTAATHHLLDLQINRRATILKSQDPEYRSTMVFAWWMACICDAYGSAYYRRKPVLDDEDYDIDFYTGEPVKPNADAHGPMPSPREQLESLGYYDAAHSLARTVRHMSRQLWKPATENEGIPYENLRTFATALTRWRDKFLQIVGVPKDFRGNWDFVSAVSSCASDATYHVMWIILFDALDDFGVKELRNNSTSPSLSSHIEEIKKKIADEALHGALRIAGLAAVLTSHGYLRLDPAVMHVSCIQAGTFLARLGRPEVKNCTAGLRQYSYSYEEAGKQAENMEQTYNKVVKEGEPQYLHMASMITRTFPPPSPADDDDMDIEESITDAYARASSYSTL